MLAGPTKPTNHLRLQSDQVPLEDTSDAFRETIAEANALWTDVKQLCGLFNGHSVEESERPRRSNDTDVLLDNDTGSVFAEEQPALSRSRSDVSLMTKSQRRSLRNSARAQSRRRPVTSLDDIPFFIKTGRRHLEDLKTQESTKRMDFDRAVSEIKAVHGQLAALYEKATTASGVLRKQQRQLSQFAEQLARLGKARDTETEKIVAAYSRLEDERKKLLGKISNPQWEVTHHFHMFAVEHFRGNLQPHLLEIAEVLNGRLGICAMAHSYVQRVENLTQRLLQMQNERQTLQTKLSQVKKRRTMTQNHLKDYRTVMNIMKQRLGADRLQNIRKTAAKERVDDSKMDTTESGDDEKQSEPSMTPSDHRMRNMPPHMLAAAQHNSRRPVFPPGGLRSSRSTDRLRYGLYSQLGFHDKKPKMVDLKDLIKQVNDFLGCDDDDDMSDPLLEEKEDPEEVSELNHSLSIIPDEISSTTSSGLTRESNGPNAPHHDWSLLAQSLKRHSVLDSQRRQIWMELEQILAVREGLKSGFEQLQRVFSNRGKNDRMSRSKFNALSINTRLSNQSANGKRSSSMGSLFSSEQDPFSPVFEHATPVSAYTRTSHKRSSKSSSRSSNSSRKKKKSSRDKDRDRHSSGSSRSTNKPSSHRQR